MSGGGYGVGESMCVGKGVVHTNTIPGSPCLLLSPLPSLLLYQELLVIICNDVAMAIVTQRMAASLVFYIKPTWHWCAFW